MAKNLLFLLSGLILMAAGATGSLAQESPRSDVAVYSGDLHAFQLKPPSGWVLDLENAYTNGYTAVLYPDSQIFVEASMIIYIWAYPLDSLGFQEYISADSTFYLESNIGLEFISTDTVYTPQEFYWVILEAADPGAESDIALIGYLDGETDIIIYQLDITDRISWADAAPKFAEAMANLTVLDYSD